MRTLARTQPKSLADKDVQSAKTQSTPCRIALAKKLLLTLALTATSALAFAATAGAATSSVAPSATTPAGYHAVRACSEPPPGYAACDAVQNVPENLTAAEVHANTIHARELARQFAHPATNNPNPLGNYFNPALLHNAYELPTTAPATTQTVGIVDAYVDPTAEADLGVYSSTYSLPSCTTSNGCFREVKQNPSYEPSSEAEKNEVDSWAVETSLDIDMVHAICPHCHILLIAAENASFAALDTAENETITDGATEVSNSWTGPEEHAYASYFEEFAQNFNHPGVAIVVASGDNGYLNGYLSSAKGNPGFPASAPYVTSVGGTSVTCSGTINKEAGTCSGSWSSTVWAKSGGGCSSVFTAQAWQSSLSAYSGAECSGKRLENDVAVVGNPNTGVEVYDSTPTSTTGNTGWSIWGGTSVASPIVAAEYGLAGGAHGVSYAASTLYSHLGNSSDLKDVVSGTNADSTGPTCHSDIACVAASGYDGPSGVGSPLGLGAFGVAPSNSALPTVSGEAEEGHTLSASTGTWNGTEPITYTYQWQHCNISGGACANISGATSSSYTLTSTYVGYTLRVIVTADNEAGETSADSAVTAEISNTPTTPATPTLSTNSPAYNTALESSAGTGSTGTPAPTYTYQWQRCTTTSTSSCSNISAAISQSYTPVSADVGEYLRVGVTATNSAGTSSTAYSAESTSDVVGATPTSPSTPTLSTSSPAYNTSLESSAGTGSTGTPAPTYSYQWQRCTTASTGSCSNISGASSQAYTPVSADIGDYLRVGVTASSSQGLWSGNSATTYSSESSSGVTGTTPTTPSTPILGTNTPAYSTQLASSGGTGSTGTPTPTYSYQWQRCTTTSTSTCAGISGATSQSYTPVGADVGDYLRVGVAATNSVGAWTGVSSTAYSAESTSGVAGTTPTTPTTPTLSTNAPTYNVSLSSSEGTGSTGAPAPTYSYQWQRCTTTSTSSCVEISGASSQSYTPVGVDLGDYLRAAVTASNSAGTWSGASSTVYSAESTSAVTGTTPTTPSTPTTSTQTPAYNTTIGVTEGTGSTGYPTSITYTYQWQECTSATETTTCASIGGATSREFTPQEANVGYYLRAGATAHNSAGASAPAWSAITSHSVTGVPPTVPSPPRVNVTRPFAGHALESTAGNGSHGVPAPSYLYQWQRCTSRSEPSSCSNIAGATARSYMPTSADVGKSLRVGVESENSTGGWIDPSEPSYSEESEPVGAEDEYRYECENVSPAPGGVAPTGPAVACTEAEEAVTGSALTLTASATASAAPTTLGAVDKASAYSIAEVTGDNTGTGHGWNETISQTPFTSGSHTIGDDLNPTHEHYVTSGAAVTSVTVTNAAESTNTSPSETAVPVTLPLNVPNPTASHTTTAGDAPSVVFQTASLESGLGNFIVTPTVTIEIPANTYAGSYTSTVEADLSTGP